MMGLLYGKADEAILRACKESDKLNSPEWLEDLIDMAIDKSKELLSEKDWEQMAQKIQEEEY